MTFEHSPELNQLAAALSAAQGELRNPPKDSVNPHFKSRFADLATVRDTVKPVLTKYKLSVVQMPCEVDGVGPSLCTMLLHESGQFVRATVGLYPAKKDPQGIGSAITYARRYGLQAVLGVVADDDDDGEAATRPPQQQQRQQQPAKPGPPPADPTMDRIKAAKTVEELRAVYDGIPQDQRAGYNAATAARKKELTPPA